MVKNALCNIFFRWTDSGGVRKFYKVKTDELAIEILQLMLPVQSVTNVGLHGVFPLSPQAPRERAGVRATSFPCSCVGTRAGSFQSALHSPRRSAWGRIVDSASNPSCIPTQERGNEGRGHPHAKGAPSCTRSCSDLFFPPLGKVRLNTPRSHAPAWERRVLLPVRFALPAQDRGAQH